MNIYSKINALLTASELRRVRLLLVLMLVGMFLETLGVSLIIPVISLMINGDLVAKYPVIKFFVSFLNNPTQNTIISFAMLGLVVVFLIKNSFLAFLIWKQTEFVYDVQASLSQRLFEKYLRQPYTFYLERNSAQLVGNVTAEVGVFAGVILSTMLLYTELMVLVGIGILLLVVEPLGLPIIVIVIAGSAWGYNYLMRSRISRWGKERQIHNDMRIQHVHQGLGGAKDVKLLGREDDFLDQFHVHNIKSAHAWKLQNTFQSFPRLLFELLAVFGVAIVVMSMLENKRDINIIVPTLGLFAAAAFRLMPSVSRVMASLQSLRFNLPVVDMLYSEMMLFSTLINTRPKINTEIFKYEICLVNVSFSYAMTSRLALDNVSINIQKGESVGLIGSSGSGKSTLVDVILGLLKPNEGIVKFDNFDIHLVLRQWQDQIGYVPQSIYLTDDTLKRNVAFGVPSKDIDDRAVLRAISAAQLDEFVQSLPDGLETIVGERGVRLSGGQRQRIGIARALYHDPILLVLDEATSALDLDTERDVMKAVMELQGSKTIIIVAHRLSTIENCNRLYRLENGRVVEERALKNCPS
jgi:ABC-type multidrug transport system fused ATPase/permease subunit